MLAKRKSLSPTFLPLLAGYVWHGIVFSGHESPVIRGAPRNRRSIIGCSLVVPIVIAVGCLTPRHGSTSSASSLAVTGAMESYQLPLETPPAMEPDNRQSEDDEAAIVRLSAPGTYANESQSDRGQEQRATPL